ncbi:23494_t:CDS:2 [Entrophospora sp. SA101]|nr:23494_t:CDS:2 [Entrophospora sp. SA101]CAJ0825933.1 6949_t:CDS:2 [Entrophospora sp. SA101]CAJ0904372.1 12832_t:CDS:2 [Entrophospora sp. SA101]CAJ0913330.1 8839_t:CDS:2 [Entrophospora sp. SA101]
MPIQNIKSNALICIGLIIGIVVTISRKSIKNWYSNNNNNEKGFIKKRNQTDKRILRQHISKENEEEIVEGLEGLIGNTPLMKIKSLSKATGCEILGKAEFLNPGGSPKDRVALNMIKIAEEKGLIKPNTGCTIFEGTSGSTGISIAMISRAKGYNAWIIVPDDQAEEKYQLLEKLGATVEKVRPVSIIDKNHFVNLAKSRAQEFGKSNHNDANDNNEDNPTGYFADQFENMANFQAHYETTGPELYRQTNGNIDAIVAGAGTGGTIAGISSYLKQLIPNLKVLLVDPPGSGLYHKVKHNVMYSSYEAEGTRRRHQVDTIVEGVGLNRMTQNFNMAHGLIDDAIQVTDEEAVLMARYLVKEEGLFVGSSSAINCVGCVRVARKLGPGHRIVTILCDSGQRHLTKFW